MVTVISYPVPSPGQNVFAGNSPINIGFKREDLQILGTQQGINNTIIITVFINITAFINIGEYIHLKSGIYNVSAAVLEKSANQIRIDTQWLGSGTMGGYINYKQSWNIELDLVAPTNEAIKILPFTLRDNGDNEGNIVIDLSIVNDLAAISVPSFVSVAEMTAQRTKFDIKYREVYREATGVYTRITNPIIVIPAKEMGIIDAFNNDLLEPEYYVGYPNGAVYIHSNTAPGFLTDVNFYFDEYDQNKQLIRKNQLIGSVVSAAVYGKIFVPLDLSFMPLSEYFKLKPVSAALPQFSPTDFTNDFNII